MRISDWSSDVCSSDLSDRFTQFLEIGGVDGKQPAEHHRLDFLEPRQRRGSRLLRVGDRIADRGLRDFLDLRGDEADLARLKLGQLFDLGPHAADALRSEEHTSELQSLMRISYAVFCMK